MSEQTCGVKTSLKNYYKKNFIRKMKITHVIMSKLQKTLNNMEKNNCCSNRDNNANTL